MGTPKEPVLIEMDDDTASAICALALRIELMHGMLAAFESTARKQASMLHGLSPDRQKKEETLQTKKANPKPRGARRFGCCGKNDDTEVSKPQTARYVAAVAAGTLLP